jgi:hypothetical protein
LLSAYTDASADGLAGLIEDGEDSAGRFRRAPLAEVRHRDKDGQQEDRAPSSLLSAARREKRQRERQGRAKPSSAKVADVLGISRQQAGRLWRGDKRKGRKGIVQKIGRKGRKQLARMLALEDWQVPRSWRVLRQQTAKGGRQARPPDAPLSDADFIRSMTQQAVYDRSADGGE